MFIPTTEGWSYNSVVTALATSRRTNDILPSFHVYMSINDQCELLDHKNQATTILRLFMSWLFKINCYMGSDRKSGPTRTVVG